MASRPSGLKTVSRQIGLKMVSKQRRTERGWLKMAPRQRRTERGRLKQRCKTPELSWDPKI